VSVTQDTIPVISGTMQQGLLVSATDGEWTYALDYLTFAYQWMRCDSTGGNCVDITGATASTYLLTADDVGSAIRVRVTPTEHEAAPPMLVRDLDLREAVHTP
jgi:hypothetical protein